MLVATYNHQGSFEDCKTILVHSSIHLAEYPHLKSCNHSQKWNPCQLGLQVQEV
jgi:ssRNA-specific RNase YbeY (16S rRNA maturation enzyme)